VGDYYFEDLTPESVVKIIDGLANGEPLQAGPQNGRKSSEPLSRETSKSVESK
jgi:hypothetical protein